MGQKLLLTEEFTDTTMEKIYDDPGISAGTLFLFDPAHSLGGFTGIPATAATIPNVAAKTAAEITGAAESALVGTVTYTRESSATLLMERTLKGGVHGLPSQSAQTLQANGWFVSLPTAIRDHINANIEPGGHGLYTSLWLAKTRDFVLPNTAPQSPMHIHNTTAATANLLMHMQGHAFFPNPGADLIGRTAGLTALDTPALLAGGVSGWSGTKPTAANQRQEFGVGLFGAWASLNINKCAGVIIYRAKIEDLYLTKRANDGAGGTLAEEYAAALAQDQDDFEAAFDVGGKFYGDTWTDPATFP